MYIIFFKKNIFDLAVKSNYKLSTPYSWPSVN